MKVKTNKITYVLLLFVILSCNVFFAQNSMSILDGFSNTVDITTPAVAANGVATVQLGDKHFLICGASSTKNSFYLYQMGAGGSFSGMKLICEFPEGGLGTATNGPNVLLPIVEKVDESLANIYVYAYNNGYAKYELKISTVLSTNEIEHDTNYIIVKNGTIHFADKSNVCVYSISGQKMIIEYGVYSIDIPSVVGAYIIKAVNHDGSSAIKKILVK
ncbi:MAG: hypothetical protein VB102_10435 [Paludibacter sp.]|nr:hypothetical protein [Paludibacter sp.]